MTHDRRGADDLYRAWERSVRRAARPGRARRVRPAAGAGLITLAAAVIIAVTVFAVTAGQGSQVLAPRADQSRSPAPAGLACPSPPGAAACQLLAAAGRKGPVTITSIASDGAAELAAGSDAGEPSVWRRAATGSWADAGSPFGAGLPAGASLAGVAAGPQGWLAAGMTGTGTARRIVAASSANGAAWQQAATVTVGEGGYADAAAAGAGGYVIAGGQERRRMSAAMWWSADMRHWVAAGNGGLDGRLALSAVYAAATTRTGFAAAGTHGDDGAVWTSADGRNWTVHDIAAPAAAISVTLRAVAVSGAEIAAGGYAVTRAGPVPVVAVTAGGAAGWRLITLPVPGGHGMVTSLAADGAGFTAAGMGAARQALLWVSSPAGMTWPAPSAAAWAGVITALSADGGTLTAAAQQGGASSLTAFRLPPED